MEKQKCLCGKTIFIEFVKMNTSQKHVNVMTDGTVSYDGAETIESIDGTEDWLTRELECEECGRVYRLAKGVLLATKTLVIKVRTIGDYDGNAADYAAVELDLVLMDRIRTISQAVRDLKTYCISDFNYACDFFVEEWDADPVNGRIAMEKFEGQMDSCTLNVTDNEFHWSGNYRNTSICWETSTVPISALEELGDLDERELFPEIQEAAI